MVSTYFEGIPYDLGGIKLSVVYSKLEEKFLNYGFKLYKTSTKLGTSDIILENCYSVTDIVNTFINLCEKRKVFVYFESAKLESFKYDLSTFEYRLNYYAKHNIDKSKYKEEIDNYIQKLVNEAILHNNNVDEFFKLHSDVYLSYEVYIIIDGLKYGYRINNSSDLIGLAQLEPLDITKNFLNYLKSLSKESIE